MLRTARYREGGEREARHARPGDEDAQVVEVGAVRGHAHRRQLAQHEAGGLGQCRGLGLDEDDVVLAQDQPVTRQHVAVLLTDGGDHHPRGQPRRQLREGAARHLGVADGDLGVVQAPGTARRDRGAGQRLEEVHAQDRADHAERVRDAVADRRILRARRVDRGLERGGAGHRPGEKARRVGDRQAGPDRRQRHADPDRERQQGQEDGLPAGRAGDAGRELPAVLDADAVEEHDEAEKAQERGRRGARHRRAQGQAREEHGPDPEREAAQVDLAHRVADPDHEEEGEERLRDEERGQGRHGALRSRPASRAGP